MKMHKRSYQEEFDMNTSFISTQQIKDLINEQKFTSTQEITKVYIYSGDHELHEEHVRRYP